MFDMEKIGERLLEERQRLGFTQYDVLHKIDITQSTLSRYEQGKRVPTLEACVGLHNIGYDVLYLITGNREQESITTDTLTTDEQKWLSLYRSSRDTGTLLKLVTAFESVD